MTKKESDSERARAKAIRAQLPEDLKAKIEELDQRLVGFLAEHDAEAGPESEDNTAIRDLRAKVAEVMALGPGSKHPSQGTVGPGPVISTMPDPHGHTIPSPPPTRPGVTRPGPAALAESRTEPDSTRLEKDFRVPSSGGRILIVDDDSSIREIIAEILRGEGYKVCPAENGKEGLKRLFQMPDCDLVLLDMMMPTLSGFDFLEIFDENPDWTMPVIILSAHMKDHDYHPGEEGSLEVFIGEKPREALKKPIYLEGFLQVVKDRVREGKLRRKSI